jgi:Hg(II)-responsive transcriptional regulator
MVDPMKTQTPTKWTRSRLAKKAGVGAETLRFYEQKGLLPAPSRNGSGYRIYQEDDLARLEFIRRSQELGFSLHDIKQLLQLTGSIRTPRQKVRSFAEARLDQIRCKIRDLQAMERALGSLVHRCDGKGALKGCPIVEFLDSNHHPIGDQCHE